MLGQRGWRGSALVPPISLLCFKKRRRRHKKADIAYKWNWNPSLLWIWIGYRVGLKEVYFVTFGTHFLEFNGQY